MVNIVEVIDRRVLGAMRLVDRATGTILKRLIDVSADNVVFIRNRSNHYVFAKVPGLENHTHTFEKPPDSPQLNSVAVTVQAEDPLNHYLPRLVNALLPRDPNPDNAANSDSLFQPQNVNLYVAANAPVRANWSTVRASTTHNNDPVRGALLRVVRLADNEVLASGISDERGEALVIIPGVPITQFADENNNDDHGGHGHGHGHDDQPVIVTELPVRLEVSFDSTTQWPINPDSLEENHTTSIRATQNLALSTGRMERAIIKLT